uniref:Uncharacterized protein n=1 Tax=Coniophora olivacea TaxID=85977 RepID=A0A896YSP4_9AGAM
MFLFNKLNSKRFVFCAWEDNPNRIPQFRSASNISKPYEMNIKRNDFSEISFSLSQYSQFKNIWSMVIKQLSSILIEISPNINQKLFIIAKLQYADGTYKSLGSSCKVSINPQFIKLYLSHIQTILSRRSNDYNVNNEQVVRIVFNFFFINPKFKEDKLAKWADLNSLDQQVKEMNLIPFKISNQLILKLPANNNYSSWGTVNSESDVNLVISLSFMATLLVWNKVTNVVTINDVSFTDEISPDGILIRTFSNNIKVYFKDGKVVLKNPSWVEYFKCIIISPSIPVVVVSGISESITWLDENF